MTKLDGRISLELEMELMTFFSESVPCEVPNHGSKPSYHAGEGEWYIITGPCLKCDDDSDVTLVCEKFKKIVEASLETGGIVPCSSCRHYNLVEDILIGFEKREK
jgi:hypothetical protein